MPPPYHEPHWSIFKDIPYQAQGRVGRSPRDWARANGIAEVPFESALREDCLDRATVRAICRDAQTDVLFAYVCAMAWGNQSDRFGHIADAWQHRTALACKLARLRTERLDHSTAYDLFTGPNQIPGLGPSFFTKLIYFFSPSPQTGSTGFYIMDQWTGKSVVLLTQSWVVRIGRTEKASPSLYNKSGNYEAYCREVEEIARLLGVSNDQAEEMLMSKGGRNDPGPWRVHVRNSWPRYAPTARYSRAVVHKTYPSIPQTRF